MSRRSFRTSWVLGLAASCLAGGALAAEAGKVTAVAGSVAGGGGGLAAHGGVAEGESLETGDDSHCSILLDENALIEMCERTKVVVEQREPGVRVVSIEAGKARVVAPDLAGERIEIHTPAAIATLLGTELLVDVNAANGDTDFGCVEHDTNVVGVDPVVKGEELCAEGSGVFVPAGGKPEAARKLDPADLERLEHCLVDLHQVAKAGDSRSQRDDSLNQMAQAETTPPVGAGPGDIPTPDLGPGPPIDDGTQTDPDGPGMNGGDGNNDGSEPTPGQF